MQHFLWEKSVFITLFGTGALLIIVTGLIGNVKIASIIQVIIPILMGIITGMIVTFVEVFIYQKKLGDTYHPT
jgi:hypothetical protein